MPFPIATTPDQATQDLLDSSFVRTVDIADVVRDADIVDVVRDADITDVVRDGDLLTTLRSGAVPPGYMPVSDGEGGIFWEVKVDGSGYPEFDLTYTMMMPQQDFHDGSTIDDMTMLGYDMGINLHPEEVLTAISFV